MDKVLWDGFADEIDKLAAKVSPAALRVYAERKAAKAAKDKGTSVLSRLFPRDPPAATRVLNEQAAAKRRKGWTR